MKGSTFVLWMCLSISMSAQPIPKSNLPVSTTERIAELLHVPKEYLTAIKLEQSKYIVVLFYDQYYKITSTRSGSNFFLKILQQTTSQLEIVASVEKDLSPYGRNFKLDLAPYRLNQEEMLIGLRYEVFPSKHPWPWLILYRIIGNKLLPVLEVDMEGHDYDWTEHGEDNIRNVLTRRIAVSKYTTNGCFDLISFATLDNYRMKPQLIKWNGSRYLVPKGFVGHSNNSKVPTDDPR